MRVVRAAQEAARLLDLLLELVLPVDAHVRAGRVVVRVVDRPRDPLGPAGGDGRREPAAGPQHAHDLGERALVVPDVLEHLGDDHAVEAVGGEGQVERVGVDHAGPLVGARLVGFDHRARDRGDVLEVGGGVVERGDARAAPHRLERVAAATRTEVEEALAGREPKPPEVNRQHRYGLIVAPPGVRFELEVVLLGGALGGLAPREPVEHAAPAAFAEAGPLLGVVERLDELHRQRVGVGGGHGHRAVARRADDLGERAAGGGDERDAAGHGLDRGEREPFVERRHDGDLRLGVQLHDALVGDAAHERDRVGEAEAFELRGNRALVPGLADHHEVRVFALGADLGQRLDEIREALERHVGARGREHAGPGTRAMCGSGRNRSWSTPTGTTFSVSRSTPICATMSFFEFSDTVMWRGTWRATLHLHAEEAVPAAQRRAPPRSARVPQVEVAVDGDRVVQRVDERPVVADEAEQAAAEALVVVDEVELGAPVAASAL